MSRLVSILCGVCLVVAGCGDSDSPSSPSTQPRAEFSQTDLVVGTGTVATTGRRLTVNYTGWLYHPPQRNRRAASSTRRWAGARRLFTLGAGEVIRGWDQGVVGMRVGGRRRWSYLRSWRTGPRARATTIPPNATLVFDIEMLIVQ